MKNSIWVLTLLSLELFGAFELQQINSEIIGNGGIVSFHPFGNNPAVINTDHKISFVSNYTNLFGIKDLHCWDFGLRFNLNLDKTLFLKATSIGDNIYRENTLIMGYGHRFSIPVSVGLSIAYYNLAVDQYTSQNSFGLSGGICYYLNPFVTMSTVLGNVNRPSICRGEEALPEFFAFGLKWKMTTYCTVSSELFKDTLFPFSGRFGMEIKPCKALYLFSGFQMGPDRFSGGIALDLFHVKFVSSIQTHLKLPETYYFGCTFQIK
ncbi:MAG: hypothetical protein JXQ65_12285 [Candidatus Marinimicrobia bacterium]|nr:hypothetical protein [Candidatus Neomarinimicrobiota bacterium]